MALVEQPRYANAAREAAFVVPTSLGRIIWLVLDLGCHAFVPGG